MEVGIIVRNLELRGNLEIPKGADSVVIFGYVSDNDKQFEKYLFVVDELQKLGIATLYFDLLADEDITASEGGFDTELLTERLIAVTKWCMEGDKTKKLRIYYLGQGVCSAAALSSAAYWGTRVKAVVSIDGRPDLAMEVLDLIESPTLLIVSNGDKKLSDFNKQAYQKMGCVKKTEIVPVEGRAGEDSWILEKVAELTGLWFAKHG